MNRERDSGVDALIPADTPDAERQRLQHVHELLLQADAPPELSPELEAGPNLGLTLGKRRRAAKARAMLLLAAALTVVLVFLGGYAIGNRQHETVHKPVQTLTLEGTSLEPHAQATLEVWHPRHGNWPMTLSVSGLSQLQPRRYYEVYVVRGGKVLPWARCGMFRVSSRSQLPLVVTLNAPYPLQHGDSWVVTREGAGGREPGETVLRPVNA